MLLSRFRIQNYKVIDDTDWVPVDSYVTALVGKNESGKTGIMRALWKTKNVAGKKFDKLYDYPRGRFAAERKGTQAVTQLEFDLTDAEAAELSAQFLLDVKPKPRKVVLTTFYKGDKETETKVTFEEEIEAA